MEYLEKIGSYKAIDLWKLVGFTLSYYKKINPNIDEEVVLSNIPYIYFKDISFEQALKICTICEEQNKREFNKFKTSFPDIIVDLTFRHDKKFRESYELSTFSKLYNVKYLIKKDQE